MAEKDTIKLLRECDSGVKMGIQSIDDVLPYVESKDFEMILTECKRRHERLENEIDNILEGYQDEGKEPSLMVRSMSWAKTKLKMLADGDDKTIAALMTDGCNMGIRSLYKYLNEYEDADEEAKNVARRAAALEKRLVDETKNFL